MANETATRLVREAQVGEARDLEVLLAAMRPVLFAYFVRQVDDAAAACA